MRSVSFVFGLEPRCYKFRASYWISVQLPPVGNVQLIYTHPVRVYISQTRLLLRKVSSDVGWIFWCWQEENIIVISWLKVWLMCRVYVDLCSPAHFVLIWQVAQMLNQHFHSIGRHSTPVRPGGWAEGFISVWHIKQPICLNAPERKCLTEVLWSFIPL